MTDETQTIKCASCSCGAGAAGPQLAEVLPRLGWKLISRRWWCASCLAVARDRLRLTPDLDLARNR